MGPLLLAVFLTWALAERPARAEPVVPGYELVLRQPEANLIEAGKLLLGELGCTNCHAPSGRAKTAPVLTGVASRLQAGYLHRYLDNPPGLKAGTTMPRLIRHLTGAARADAVSALVHFLLSLTDDASPRKLATGNEERGRALYHQVGCVACHEPDESYRPASWSPDIEPGKPDLASVPLGDLHLKYRPGQLARFLLNPLRVRPSARMPRTPLSVEEAADLETYLTGGRTVPHASPAPDSEKAAHGRDLFSRFGCASCHEMLVNGTKLRSNVHVRPLPELGDVATRGCLADSPPPGAPDFGLTVGQREAIRKAIGVLAEGGPAPWSARGPAQGPEDSPVRQRLAALNCLACHVRDGVGGPDAARAFYFETVEDRDLGDEGRLPPRLTGVGRKLTADALYRAIHGAAPVRPYLATRMPDYGTTRAAELTELLQQADLSDDIASVERSGRNRYGRRLVGPAGLGCVGCHDLHGHKSSGIGAIDLAHAPRRLRVEWFRDFLIDPARFLPGTRMPSFWPHGQAVNKEVLRGHTERQIDSIWVYLMEIDQTRLPEGMEERKAFELKPADRPIVFRTFMTGVGMHAIAVGFPEGIHAAFDSKQIRWAQAWRGRFLDAESTWDDRFTPLTPALSDDLVSLPPGPSFAILPDKDSPWPASSGIPAAYRFRGFRLDEAGVPVFLYELGGLRFEDRLTPAPDGRSLRREVRLRGKTKGLWFRAGVGKRIETHSGGSYRIDGRLRVRVEGAKPIIRRSHSGTGRARDVGRLQELVAPVGLAEGQGVLVQEISW